MGGGKGEGCFSYNYMHVSPFSSPPSEADTASRGEDFILLQFKISAQVSVIHVDTSHSVVIITGNEIMFLAIW